MRKFITLGAVFVCVLLALTGLAYANLVTNGSFEDGIGSPSSPGFATLAPDNTDITGWKVINRAIEWINDLWPAFAGTHSLDLNGCCGPGGVVQTIPTTPGQSYTLTFYLAGNPDGPPGSKTIAVSAGATSQIFSFDITGHDYSNMGWTKEFMTFTATDVSTLLKFESTSTTTDPCDCYGPALDNVEITPEPATVGLVAVGLAGLGIIRRRKAR